MDGVLEAIRLRRVRTWRSIAPESWICDFFDSRQETLARQIERARACCWVQLWAHQAVWFALVLAGKDLGRLCDGVARGCLLLDAPQTIAEVLGTQLDRRTVDTLVPILLKRRLVLIKVIPCMVHCKECSSIATSACRVIVNGCQLSGGLKASEAIRGCMPRPRHLVNNLL